MAEQQPTIRPIKSTSIVENGAFIVVCGKCNSGKTCVIENLFLYNIDSFKAKYFSPLYIAQDAEFGRKYFGNLFTSYLPMTVDTKHQVEIWQFGYEDELEASKFKRQGELYVASQSQDVTIRKRPKPRILFYFDRCNSVEELNFTTQCLANVSNHRKKHFISIVETTSMENLSVINEPDIMIFTSRIDLQTSMQFFMKLLDCNRVFAEDLITTANSFIDSCHVALVINVHQWIETFKKRGLFIYVYELVPPLDERIPNKTLESASPRPSAEVSKKRHRRHRHRKSIKK